MPAKSKKQAKFMRAVAHSREFAKKVGVPQSVGKEFFKSEGGEMKESKAMMKREVAFMKRKGAPKSMIAHEESEMRTKKMLDGGPATATLALPPAAAAAHRPGRTRARQSERDTGALARQTEREKIREAKHPALKPAVAAPAAAAMKRGGAAKKVATKKMAGGGLAAGHKSADGVATKGRTKAKQITMKKGGKC